MPQCESKLEIPGATSVSLRLKLQHVSNLLTRPLPGILYTRSIILKPKPCPVFSLSSTLWSFLEFETKTRFWIFSNHNPGLAVSKLTRRVIVSEIPCRITYLGSTRVGFYKTPSCCYTHIETHLWDKYPIGPGVHNRCKQSWVLF